MGDKCCTDFQKAIDDFLVRHRSVLDVMTKYQESSARVNRAVAKAVTECGCITITATRQQAPAETEYRDLKQFMSPHMTGELCEQCQEVLTKELGHNLFYLTALCNLTGIKLHDVLQEEYNKVNTLGFFHLS